MTDSWTIDKASLRNEKQRKFMRENCIHYVASSEELGTTLKGRKSDVCVEKSAGHTRHEYTTGYAYDEIMK